MKMYGIFKVIKEPEWITHSWGTKELIGTISFKNIKQYAQYSANRWGGWGKPDCIIHYLNGKKEKIFKKI